MSENTPVATYETLYQQLQEVVNRLEAGTLPLEESLQLYEQGVQLAAACQRLLDTAELRIEQLQVGMGESAD
ncbi:MAG: exodeoxyribonuclease VII small subunit [Chloroflexaceae bacterium]